VLERAIWTGSIAGYLFHNLFVFDNIVSYIFYMTVLAYIAWRSGVTTRVWIGKNEVEERSVYTMVLPTVLVVTLVVLYVANYKGIATATTLLQALTQQQGGIENNLHLYQEALAYNSLGRQEVAEQTVQIANQVAGATTVDTKTQQQFFTLAVNAMNAELARNPDSARLQLFTGSLLSRYGRNQEALTYLEKARQLSPTKQTVLFQLGEVYLTLGKTVEAEATMKEAFELDTAYDEARKLYALTALYAGDKAASNAVLLEGFGTTTINDDRFLAAYANSNRFDLVVAVWKMRIAANPTDVQSHVSLAAAYIKLGMRQEAIQELQTVATLNPAFQSQVDTFIADIRAGKDPTNTTTTP
jgi:tetratricopeptide (TPR) repeat protein